MTGIEQIRTVLKAQAGDRDSIETLLRELQTRFGAIFLDLLVPPQPRTCSTPHRDDLQLLTSTDEFLALVSPASRAVLVLHYLHEHSLEEVAAILEISVGTAKSRLACGLTRLRDFVNKKGVKQ